MCFALSLCAFSHVSERSFSVSYSESPIIRKVTEFVNSRLSDFLDWWT